MGPMGPMLPRRRPKRRCFRCYPARSSVSSESSVVRSPRRLAPGREHGGQRRVGLRAALVNVRDDGLCRDDSGRLARLAPLLRRELLQSRRPDRPDAERLDPRQRPGPDRAVGKAPEGVQVEPDHLGVAAVEAPEDEVPGLPLQPVERGAERRLLGCAPLPAHVFHARPPASPHISPSIYSEKAHEFGLRAGRNERKSRSFQGMCSRFLFWRF